MQRADHPQMVARLAEEGSPLNDSVGGEVATLARVGTRGGALTGALEQIAELRERVETLEAGGKTRKAPGRKIS